MPHVRQIETAVSSIFHAGEPIFKKWCYAIRSGAAVFRTEIKVAAVPLCINIHYIAETLIFGRRLDVIRLKERFHKLLCFCFHLYLYILWHFGLGRFWRTVDPDFLSSFHVILILLLIIQIGLLQPPNAKKIQDS